MALRASHPFSSSGDSLARIVIEQVRPRTPNGLPAKGAQGHPLVVAADVFTDGHDVIAARARLVGPGGWESSVELQDDGNDCFEGVITPEVLGLHHLVIEAWRDRFATWAARTTALARAGEPFVLELADGEDLLVEAAGLGREPQLLAEVAERLRDARLAPEMRLQQALRPEIKAAMAGPIDPSEVVASVPMPIWVERPRAAFSSWYELFPRSYGGFRGVVEKRLEAIAEMGFDVLYLPPIHPIGRTARKGRGGALQAGPGDPGSPWAIGGPEGGHEAIHPELGTAEDFRELVEAARSLGIEVALDYALQCSPDHPWVREHPAWFRWRRDGTIAYAENPPKKYQDIVPLNFWAEPVEEREALWKACLGILEHWIGFGVKIFRVDNPHTKPVAFWAWLIEELRRRHPDVILLSEAFTKPKMMAKLAEVGFSQSYTYFTWRTTKEELASYGLEVSRGPASDYLRPNFWPTTPDILSGPLRRGPRAAFALRAVLAATMSANWGIYSGYELCENEPASEDNEEFFDSEKYRVVERDFSAPDSLAPLLRDLNAIRRSHPALQQQRGLEPLATTNPQLLAYARYTADKSDSVLVVVNLDPLYVQSGHLHLDSEVLGWPREGKIVVEDLLANQRFVWEDADPYIRLDPALSPAHVVVLGEP
jgi:starch synthase (maltosyl-transferring)